MESEGENGPWPSGWRGRCPGGPAVRAWHPFQRPTRRCRFRSPRAGYRSACPRQDPPSPAPVTVPTELESAPAWPPFKVAANDRPSPSWSPGSLVVNATTPPNASLPYSEEIGPRAISSRARLSTSTKSRRALRNGPNENSSGTRTPSISVRTRLPPMPRILNPVNPKRLPVPDTETPGSKRTKSAMSPANSLSISSAVLTETVAATSSSERSVRVATTVIVSTSSASSSPMIGVARKPAVRIATAASWRHAIGSGCDVHSVPSGQPWMVSLRVVEKPRSAEVPWKGSDPYTWGTAPGQPFGGAEYRPFV